MAEANENAGSVGVESEEEIDIESLPQCVREILYRVQPQCERYVLEMLAEFQEMTAHAVAAEMERQHGESSAEQSTGIRESLGSGDAEFHGENSERSGQGSTGTRSGGGGEQSGLSSGRPTERGLVGTTDGGGVVEPVAASHEHEGNRPDQPGGINGGSEDAGGGECTVAADSEHRIEPAATGESRTEPGTDECILRRNEPAEGDRDSVNPTAD